MQFKPLKQELEIRFAVIQKKVQEGELPLEIDVSAFLRLTRQLQHYAGEDWTGECEDFYQLAGQLHIVVKKGKNQDAIRLVESLNDAKIFCHQTFRYVNA